MTRAEAESLAARLQAEHVQRRSYRFVAKRKADDSWSVAKLRLPEQLRTAPLRTKAEHPPHEAFSEDVRSGHETRIPGLPGGLGI